VRAVTWLADDRLEVDGVLFVAGGGGVALTPTAFPVNKPPDLLRAFVDLALELDAPRVVEIGTQHGGSAALLALLSRPTKLVTVDIRRERPEALLEAMRIAGMGQRVAAYEGIDQGDRARLARILDDELGDDPIDLVVDDASHELVGTRSTFEQLFPRLRPGGRYLIEDWSWEQRFADMAAVAASPAERPTPEAPSSVWTHPDFIALLDEQFRPLAAAGPDGRTATPLLRLAVELLLACAGHHGVIDDVRFTRHWIVVERGPGALDPATFSLSDIAHDHFGLLRDS
jgi:predicted O-methyltransferase YrrM